MRAALGLPALFACLAHAQTAAPDPIDLVRRSADAHKANGIKARQYTFREHKVNRDFDKDGKAEDVRSETWEIIGLEGSTYRKLILRNDKPLPPKEQKREDDRLRQEAARRKRETPEQRRQRLFSFSYSFRFPYPKTPELYDLRYKGEETMRGRRSLIVEGIPKPGLQPSAPDEKEALNYHLKVWLDAADLCLARIEMEVVGEKSRVKKGSLISQDSSRNEDGVWLPLETNFRYSVRFFKMISGRGEHTTTYSDYRKFQVDSRILDASEK